MSATRASGANRTNARGGGAPRSRVIGSLELNDAVWKVEVWFLTSTAPITPACNNSASAPRLADQASVRGERLAKKPATRAERLSDAVGRRAGSASIAEQLLHGARRRRAEAFVEMDGLGEFFADHGILPGEFGIAGQRFLDFSGIPRIERTGRVPRQQQFDLARFRLDYFSARSHHGQPRSIPAALSSSANFLRA